MSFVSRSAWAGNTAAKAPAHALTRRTSKPLGVMVHHTAAAAPADVPAYLRWLYDWNTRPVAAGGRGYSDIEYHAAVDQAGNVYELRDADTIGAHCKGTGLSSDGLSGNVTHLGVAMLLDATKTAPSVAMVKALDLYAYFARLYIGRDPSINYHGQAAATACCGSLAINGLRGRYAYNVPRGPRYWP